MRRRTFLSIVPALVALPAIASAQGMDRSGVLDIRNDEEKRVFGDLQCTCGCPRESIATCTCGIAAGFREDVRAMMARGMTQEEIKAEWVRRYGPQALTVPENVGVNRLLYIAPLAAIVGMGAFAVSTLRRFRRKAEEKRAPAPLAGAKRDEYDDKLDEELRQLDDERATRTSTIAPTTRPASSTRRSPGT
jgi:cytochrome c-type biogenesis protein CcmH/NrfF